MYSQKFSYDRFGNRYLKASENSAANDPLFPFFIEENNVDRATNRLASNTNTSYDESGGVVTDNKFRGLKYFYDANGRMVKSSTLSDVEVGIAVMDAAGNKVAERVNDVWRFAVYDAFGRLVADYGGLSQTDGGGVKFVQQDIRGSTRCVTSISGSVLARMDYQAFGEQIPSNIGQRTAIGFASSDSIRHRYALTENDTATGLNDTWWRKLENRSGRWTSPDPYNGSMSISDPQSLNRYSYVANQPTNFIDPSGLNMAGPNTRYYPFDPFGIAYYVDGVLSDARTAWSILGAGAGWLDYSNLSEVSYATFGHFDNDQWTRDFQIIHIWAVMGGDCPPGFACDELGGVYPVGQVNLGPCGNGTVATSASAQGNSVVYGFSNGRQETRRGGSRAWRNNNPGNIRPGHLQGEIGTAGGFAVFSSETIGQIGILGNLYRNYMDLTVFDAIERWAPPRENNTSNYQTFVHSQTGLNGQTPMNTLSQGQLNSVANAIRSIEGWKPGTVICGG